MAVSGSQWAISLSNESALSRSVGIEFKLILENRFHAFNFSVSSVSSSKFSRCPFPHLAHGVKLGHPTLIYTE